jgi:diguanylate cyclase (GGDEF)-like protein
MIDANEAAASERERLYTFLIQALLGAYADHLTPGSPLHVQVKLLQRQLDGAITSSELHEISRHVDLYADHIAKMRHIDAGILEVVLAPLVEYYSGKIAPGAPTSAPAARGPAASVQPLSADEQREEVAEVQAPAVHGPPSISTYQRYVTTTQRELQDIQSTLAKRIQETISRNEQFGVLLDVVRDELLQAHNVEDVERARRQLLDEVDNLSKSNQVLEGKLSEAYNYLQIIESGSRELSDELTRVRQLSLTDELTELPNRRAFLRRLEDEVGRAQRYGSPLALVMIDLDYFKEINDRYGHAMGDATLRSYAQHILTVFRHHDMVARYGGEEFAVLLTNADQEGAMAALNKARRLVAEVTCQENGTVINLPTFSAGVALYSPGETPTTLVQRADEALYRAKQLGRNRIELDQVRLVARRGQDERARIRTEAEQDSEPHARQSSTAHGASGD